MESLIKDNVRIVIVLVYYSGFILGIWILRCLLLGLRNGLTIIRVYIKFRLRKIGENGGFQGSIKEKIKLEDLYGKSRD